MLGASTMNLQKNRVLRFGAGLLIALSLAACDGRMQFPVTEDGQADLKSRGINIIPVTTKNIDQFRDVSGLSLHRGIKSNPPRDPSVYSYHIAVGDRLQVQTWSTPERTQSADETNLAQGPIVNEKGTFFYPFVGDVSAEGKTVEAVRNDLSAKLEEYIAEPQVEISVSEFNGSTATVLGEIGSPGPLPVTNVPMRLLDAVNKAGVGNTSDLRQVEIRRGSSSYLVNLEAYMQEGRRGHNPIILPNDTIFVPALADNKVFTFGEIGVGEIPIGAAKKTLTEILAGAGGLDRMTADARGVFVFRKRSSSENGFDVFQFNLRNASSLMLTSDFAMAPLDIVFVTNDPISRWNDTVGKLLSPLTGVIRARAVAEAITP